MLCNELIKAIIIIIIIIINYCIILISLHNGIFFYRILNFYY